MSQSLTQRDDDLVDGALVDRVSPPRMRHGGLGVAAAIVAVMLVGAVGLAADPAASHADERMARAAVAEGALAGAAALGAGGDAVDAAAAALARNGLAQAGGRGHDSLVINRPPQAGPYAGRADAVEVVLVRIQAVGMAHMALGTAMPMRIRAVALGAVIEPGCAVGAERPACPADAAAVPSRAPRLVE